MEEKHSDILRRTAKHNDTHEMDEKHSDILRRTAKHNDTHEMDEKHRDILGTTVNITIHMKWTRNIAIF
jgi:hypothetical protein